MCCGTATAAAGSQLAVCLSCGVQQTAKCQPWDAPSAMLKVERSCRLGPALSLDRVNAPFTQWRPWSHAAWPPRGPARAPPFRSPPRRRPRAFTRSQSGSRWLAATATDQRGVRTQEHLHQLSMMSVCRCIGVRECVDERGQPGQGSRCRRNGCFAGDLDAEPQRTLQGGHHLHVYQFVWRCDRPGARNRALWQACQQPLGSRVSCRTR